VSPKGVRVAHAIPGRIRLKIEQIRNDPARAWDVEEQLSRLPGVSDVEANPVTGSVIVRFEDPPGSATDSLAVLSSTWPAALGALDLAALENGHANGSNGATPAAPLDRRIVEVFGSLNAGVADATRGTDLKVIVPMALFVLGVRGLFSEKLPFPAWYDFFWFALSTFIMLNRSVIDTPAELAAS
jgi:heavy-metal-associated domain-containing protein